MTDICWQTTKIMAVIIKMLNSTGPVDKSVLIKALSTKGVTEEDIDKALETGTSTDLFSIQDGLICKGFAFDDYQEKALNTLFNVNRDTPLVKNELPLIKAGKLLYAIFEALKVSDTPLSIQLLQDNLKDKGITSQEIIDTIQLGIKDEILSVDGDAVNKGKLFYAYDKIIHKVANKSPPKETLN